MTSSEKQIAANRTNAALGGVKTKEGKAKSKLNAIKHGVFANCRTTFDDVDFEEIFNDFAQEFGAETPSRRVLIEQLTMVYVRILRCNRFETDTLIESLNPPIYKTQSFGFDVGFKQEAEIERRNDMAPVTSSILGRLISLQFDYEPRLYNQFAKLVEQLKSAA